MEQGIWTTGMSLTDFRWTSLWGLEASAISPVNDSSVQGAVYMPAAAHRHSPHALGFCCLLVSQVTLIYPGWASGTICWQGVGPPRSL